MSQAMSNERLRSENLTYAGTGGVSQVNRVQGFVPAFYDPETDTVELSRFANGSLAPIHLLEGLPEDWVVERSLDGMIRAIKESVIAGFVRGEYFYTRQQAAQVMLH